jgi:hypothetical protein
VVEDTMVIFLYFSDERKTDKNFEAGVVEIQKGKKCKLKK